MNIRPSTAVVTIDGVLRKPGAMTPIREGVKLYLTLAEYYDIILASDQPEEDEDKLQAWLDDNGVTRKIGRVLWRAPGGRLAQLEGMRLSGGLIDLLVDPDPAVASAAYDHGFTVLLFLSPSYARPEW